VQKAVAVCLRNWFKGTSNNDDFIVGSPAAAA